MDAVLRECTRKLGRGRVRSLHLNDSQTAARLQPRPPREHRRRASSARTAVAAFLSRAGAGRGCRACSRRPARTAKGRRRAEVALAFELRERGARRAPLTPEARGRSGARGGGAAARHCHDRGHGIDGRAPTTAFSSASSVGVWRTRYSSPSRRRARAARRAASISTITSAVPRQSSIALRSSSIALVAQVAPRRPAA